MISFRKDDAPANKADSPDYLPTQTLAPRVSPITQNIRVVGRMIQKSFEVARQLATSQAMRSHVFSIIQSEGFLGVLRRASRIRSNFVRIEKSAAILKIDDLDLPAWLERYDSPSADELTAIQSLSAEYRAIIRVLVEGFDAQKLHATLQSLSESTFVHWQCELICAPELSKEARATLEQLIPPRAAPSTHAPHIDFIINSGTRVRRHALDLMVAWLAAHPDQILLYGDTIATQDRATTSWFKPAYTPLMARSGLLLHGVIALRSSHANIESLIKKIARDPAHWQKYIIEACEGLGATSIGHLPHVLSTTDDQWFEPQKIVSTPLRSIPRVSIIIPTRNYWSVLKPCLDSLKITDWPHDKLEIIVVDNGSDEQEILVGLAERVASGEIRVIQHDRPFNWSELNNVGVAASSGEILVFLNNDIEIIEPNWLLHMVALATDPHNGAIGCKLLYPDQTVQHGGVVLGIQGVAAHAHLFLDKTEGGYQGLANIDREVSCVTGACIVVERSKFEEIGGFDETFKVAFNDVAFCLSLKKHGYHNIYAANVVLIHHESKSRGYDTTPEKIERNRQEMITIWRKFDQDMRDDPLYSPNLSYQQAYELSRFPRSKPAWSRLVKTKPRVLMLSITHAKGHGVPVVVALQADALVKAGFDVIVAGPRSLNDFPYEGCTFIEVHDPETAAYIAYLYSVDCVVAHTPRFFSSVRWLGRDFPFLSYDYGEPPADWFPDREERESINIEKEICFAMSTRAYAISQAVQNESKIVFNGIIPLANSHLGSWSDEIAGSRSALRNKLGFDKRFVVLNVCRFHRGERHYKGIDRFIEVMCHFRESAPEIAEQCLFVLCGKGTPKDISEMQKEGLTVFSNVTDETMVELYVAADAYMNYSQWEGYNLGVAQALAMGLPTLASDIPAHRAFGIEVTNDIPHASEWLAHRFAARARDQQARTAKLWQWSTPLAQFVKIVSEMTDQPIQPEERLIPRQDASTA